MWKDLIDLDTVEFEILLLCMFCFFFQAEDGIRDYKVTGVQTCALPIFPVGSTGNFSSIPGLVLYQPQSGTATGAGRTPFAGGIIPAAQINPTAAAIASFRSEERRGGEKGRSRGAPDP